MYYDIPGHHIPHHYHVILSLSQHTVTKGINNKHVSQIIYGNEIIKVTTYLMNQNHYCHNIVEESKSLMAQHAEGNNINDGTFEGNKITNVTTHNILKESN